MGYFHAPRGGSRFIPPAGNCGNAEDFQVSLLIQQRRGVQRIRSRYFVQEPSVWRGLPLQDVLVVLPCCLHVPLLHFGWPPQCWSRFCLEVRHNELLGALLFRIRSNDVRSAIMCFDLGALNIQERFTTLLFKSIHRDGRTVGR